MDDIKTVVCVDNSDFYKASQYYLNKVNHIIKNVDKVIFWGSDVNLGIPTENDDTRSSHPQRFINIIKKFRFKYRLIITVVGYMDDEDIQFCDGIIKQSNILDNIVDFEIYFYGNNRTMSMKFDRLFTSKKFNKKIFINNCLMYCIDNNIDFDKLTFENITSVFKCTIIYLLTQFPEDEKELRRKIGKLFNRFSSQCQEKGSLRLFFENNDVEGCMRFIERGLDNSNVKLWHQKLKELLNLFEKFPYEYSLSDSLTVTLEIPAEYDKLYEDSETEDDSIELKEDSETEDIGTICDIMLIKCKQLCLIVRKTDEIIMPENQIFRNPFMLLKYRDLVDKMLYLVEYHQIDFNSYCNLNDKSISPFTRQPIAGIYIFNSDYELMDPDILMNHNRVTISKIFGLKDLILPRCSGLFHLLFLYMLKRFHPKWKTMSKIIMKEIKYICNRTITPVTLLPNLKPAIKDQLDIGLWYVINASHKLYPNSPNNVLRSMGEGSTYFLDVYSDIFHSVDEELYNKTKLWTVWSYMVENQGNNRKLLSEILAQYQKYIEIGGSLIFFSGQCQKRYDSILNILPVEKVLGLYHLLHENSGYFDNIDNIRDYIPKVSLINTSEPNCRDHVAISMNTCQAIIVCSNPRQLRKKCAIEYTRYFGTFHEFCVDNGEYPKEVYDLIHYHSMKHYKTSSEIVVYPPDGLDHFMLVMEKFEEIMKTYAIEHYLEVSSEYESVKEGNNIFGPHYLQHCSNERPYCVSSINVKSLTS